MKPIRWLVLSAVAIAAAPTGAQSPALAQAIQAGQVGERWDGYMGVAGNASAQAKRQVSEINIQRRKLYIELSARRNVTAELIGMATACQLFTQLAPGQAYMLNDGAWRRLAAGQSVPLPSYCR